MNARPTLKQMDAVYRQNLAMFAGRTFTQLNPGTLYLPNWHVDAMASRLQDCATGKIRRLIINVPPRYMKSLTASVGLPAWILGRDPSARIIAASYAEELALKHSHDCRAVMQSDWYARMFPATQLSPTRNAVKEFETTRGGYRMATSVGGSITGRGGDYLILDDPLKPDEALSEAMRRRVNTWYDSVLYSRLNNKNTGTIIIVMHRLHEDDLVGHVLESEPWEVLSIPAIAETDEVVAYNSLRGAERHVRRAGDILHPDFESVDALARMRKTIGEYNFAGQYQQAPAPLGGGMVKLDWLVRYADGDLPKFDQIVLSVDTAIKPTELADYSAFTIWGIKDAHAYLLHVFRDKMGYPKIRATTLELADRFRATVVLVEDKASGTQLIQELQEAGIHGVKAYTPKGDKVMRLHAQCATIEQGMVHVPQSAPWLAEYLHELTTFPGSKNDDQVDSTSQALEWLKMGQRHMGLFNFYKEDHEKRMARMRGEAV